MSLLLRRLACPGAGSAACERVAEAAVRSASLRGSFPMSSAAANGWQRQGGAFHEETSPRVPPPLPVPLVYGLCEQAGKAVGGKLPGILWENPQLFSPSGSPEIVA